MRALRVQQLAKYVRVGKKGNTVQWCASNGSELSTKKSFAVFTDSISFSCHLVKRCPKDVIILQQHLQTVMISF